MADVEFIMMPFLHRAGAFVLIHKLSACEDA